MEDPAATARDQLGRRIGDDWDGPKRRRRSPEGLLVVLFIVLAAGAIWWTVQRADEAGAGDPATRVARGEVVGLTGDSLARPVNLVPVLTAMAATAAPDDRLLSLRITPGQVLATVVTPDGAEYFLDGDLDGDVTRREFAQTNRTATTAFARVDPTHVKRAVNTVVRLSGLPATALDHMVLNWRPGGEQTIFVRFTADRAGDRDWVGTGDGSTMRRINVPDGADTTATPSRDARDRDERLRRLQDCVAAAAGDPEALMECIR